MTITLYVGNKNYSSWSLRPWLVLRWAGIAFEEKLIRLDQKGYGKHEIDEVLKPREWTSISSIYHLHPSGWSQP